MQSASCISSCAEAWGVQPAMAVCLRGLWHMAHAELCVVMSGLCMGLWLCVELGLCVAQVELVAVQA